MQACDLQPRESQYEMMRCIEETINQRRIACIEAPTGVGKTLAYLLTALENKTKDEVIIISTATIALQEQILYLDMPKVEKILGRKVKSAMAKGRRRYTCISRLFNFDQYHAEDIMPESFAKLQEAFENDKWDGEKESLPRRLTNRDWQKISTDSHGCAGGRCNYIDQCPFFIARKDIELAEVIVTNHSLLLSDLELGGGVILPKLDNAIVIIDECHHLAEKATNFFALQAAVMGSTDWINHLSKSINAIKLQIKLDDKFVTNLQTNIKALVASLHDVKLFIDENSKDFEKDRLRIKKTSEELVDLAKTLIHFADQFSQACESITQKLENALELLHSSDKDRADMLSSQISTMQFILSRSENLAQTWQHMIKDVDNFGVPVAKWIEKKKTKSDAFSSMEDDYTCHASPINASEKLKSLFWNKIKLSVILCSATIKSLGNFNDYVRKAGLKNDKRLTTLALTSPFDYKKSLLFIPEMKNEPNYAGQAKHLQECADIISKLYLPSSGTLVLFTSIYAMEEVQRLLPEEIQSHIIMQGDTGKSKLIEEHKEKVDKGTTSVLFGLASFAEGLDLPGKYCQHVIIHKLPFAVPSDPIELTRSEWLESHKLNPFKLVTLPYASLKLTQFAGRLIRKEDDYGIVTILDKRLLTKFYGKLLISSLPPFQQMLNNDISTLKSSELVEALF